ncbi:MAG TPA: hypothetical protein VKB49_30300 [Candidatus Sulfotelmatobacter sp.]|nr:hypothetical protein [Candidatus Sulfotelmatobacter sp.]
MADIPTMTMIVRKHRTKLLVLFFGTVIFAVFCLLYSIRLNRCVLYYYGASPEEVPQGTAIAILNPLRNRKDETNAQWLIRDLRTDKCEEIARERLAADPVRICSVMRGNTQASLIWLDPESDTMSGRTRRLIYDLPDRKVRLVVYFAPDEDGWGVRTASIAQ